MSEAANWPIRVGGIYNDPRVNNLKATITAIDGDTLYYDIICRQSSKRMSSSMSVFRELWSPEDQSPLPALAEDLKEIEYGLESALESIGDGDEESILTLRDLVPIVKRALGRIQL